MCVILAVHLGSLGEGISSKLFPDMHAAHSPRSEDGDEGSVVSGVTRDFTVTLDQDMGRMENLLEQWTAELKRNVLVRGLYSNIYTHATQPGWS